MQVEALIIVYFSRSFPVPLDISAFPVLPVIFSHLFRDCDHHASCDKDFASALEKEDNRSVINFPDIITVNNIRS